MADLPRPFGPYTLLKSLGTGGTGDVFLARPQGDLPSPVVIKRLHGQLASQTEFVKRFHHEAEIAIAIDSPHVAKVYDAGRVEDTFYITMEYLAGWTVARVMKDLLEAGGSASIGSVVDVVRGGLAGLAALHSARHPGTQEALGIIHRDIAPKNLMIGEDGVTRLIDLGLGKSNLQDWRTGTGVVMGSPGYMAPEQVVAEGVDQRSDLFAMGIVLWEFLTLKRFIKRAPIPIMLRAQVKPIFTPPSQHRSDIPAALDAICEKALKIDPSQRFQTAAELIAALDEAVPAREEEAPLATIVGEMLFGELAQSKTEVTKLLSVTPADRVQAIEIISVPVAAAPTPTPTPMALATPVYSSYSVPPPRARGVPLWGVLALMTLTLLVGLGGGAILLGDRGAQPLAARRAEPTSAVAVPAIEPVVQPEPPPEPEAPKPAESPRTVRPVRRIAKVDDPERRRAPARSIPRTATGSSRS